MTQERLLAALLILWIVVIPLPFGGNVEAAQPLTLFLPFVLCLLASVARYKVEKERVDTPSALPAAYSIATGGAALFLVVVSIQLVPLPAPVLAFASPAAANIWAAATEVLTAAGAAKRTWFPMSVDPDATLRELVRLAAIFAAFQAAALVIRTHERRMALASALGTSAMFQVIYAVHEAALGRFAIWGWKNTKIFGRMTGTYVNPNHFGHYLAIAVPLLAFVAACYWHEAGPRHARKRQRLAYLLERHFLVIGTVAVAVTGCAAGILLAQSRGSLLALTCGGALSVALVTGFSGARRKRKALAVAIAAGAVAVLAVVALAVFLGEERTVSRFMPSEQHVSTLVGRKTGFTAALEIWTRFPLFGAGAGAFESVVSIGQKGDPELVYNHAHNDYMEIAATTGTIGLLVALVTICGAAVSLWRSTVGARVADIRWRRRAFHVAALAALLIAAVHALIDFNFFIPANALTLAVILGSATAPLHQDNVTRR